jgi:hypothetical protein
MYALLAEWMLGAPLPDYSSDFMERSSKMEDEAVKAYEFETDLKTERVGFITDDSGLVGCSPDRLVGDDGCLEIKCPAANTHVGHMIERKLDEKHAPQTQGQLLVTGRAWVDTVSFYPGLPIVIIRTSRRNDYIEALSAALDSFVRTMLKARDAINRLPGGPFPVTPPKPLPEDFGTFGISDEDATAIWNARQIVTDSAPVGTPESPVEPPAEPPSAETTLGLPPIAQEPAQAQESGNGGKRPGMDDLRRQMEAAKAHPRGRKG